MWVRKDGMITENKQQHQETRENIQRRQRCENENAEMEKSHKTKANEFKGDYNERVR